MHLSWRTPLRNRERVARARTPAGTHTRACTHTRAQFACERAYKVHWRGGVTRRLAPASMWYNDVAALERARARAFVCVYECT